MSVLFLLCSLALSVGLILTLIVFLILLLSVAVLVALLSVAHNNITSFLDFEAILPLKKGLYSLLKKT